MKTLNSILGAIITSGIVIGVVFKIMHWPGGGIFTVVFSSLLSMYVIPVAVGNMITNKKKPMLIVCNAIGAFAGMIWAIGLLFKIQHWPGSGPMLFMAMILTIPVCLLFMVLFIVSKEPINLSPGTFFVTISFGFLIYAVSSASYSKSVFDFVVTNEIIVEKNLSEIENQNELFINKSKNQEHKKIYTATQDLTNYISKLKSELYAITDGLPHEIADTIHLELINSKDNYDIPTHLLGLSEPANPRRIPGMEEFSVITLREKIEDFNSIITAFNPNSKIINTNTSYQYRSNVVDSWEVSTFYHAPLASIILRLTQIQLEANIMCNTILTNSLLQESITEKPDTIN